MAPEWGGGENFLQELQEELQRLRGLLSLLQRLKLNGDAGEAARSIIELIMAGLECWNARTEEFRQWGDCTAVAIPGYLTDALCRRAKDDAILEPRPQFTAEGFGDVRSLVEAGLCNLLSANRQRLVRMFRIAKRTRDDGERTQPSGKPTKQGVPRNGGAIPMLVDAFADALARLPRQLQFDAMAAIEPHLRALGFRVVDEPRDEEECQEEPALTIADRDGNGRPATDNEPRDAE